MAPSGKLQYNMKTPRRKGGKSSSIMLLLIGGADALESTPVLTNPSQSITCLLERLTELFDAQHSVTFNSGSPPDCAVG